MSKLARLHILSQKWILTGLLIASLFVLAVPSAALAGASDKVTLFICPSVSTHNANGMWVIGLHGAYYVIIPNQGGVNKNDGDPRVYVTVPAHVVDKAQIPAGWGLYKDYPSYPYFEGMAVLLEEGIETWLGSPFGWEEGDVVSVINNGDGTYTVNNMGPMMDPSDKGTITIYDTIDIYSAVLW